MKRVMLLIVVAVALAGVGCSKKKNNAASVPPVTCDRAQPDCGGINPDAPGGGGFGGGGPTEYGAESEVPLSTNRATLSQFFFQSPVTNPTNVRVGMQTAQDSTGGYGGYVWVAFEDNGVTRTAVLSTYHPHYTGVSNASNNVWFTYNGQSVWHGFFQDKYGAIIVVVDNALNLGDGTPSELVGGSVWFQNFPYIEAPQGPMKMCWDISYGIYDCRTWIVNGKVQTTSALYPTNVGTNANPARPAYTKLGSFYGMKRSAAFGN